MRPVESSLIDPSEPGRVAVEISTCEGGPGGLPFVDIVPYQASPTPALPGWAGLGLVLAIPLSALAFAAWRRRHA